MPAKAGIQNYLKSLDSCLRRNDVKGRFRTYYETINSEFCLFKKDSAKRFHPSTFNIRYSIFCGSLFRLNVSYKRSGGTET